MRTWDEDRGGAHGHDHSELSRLILEERTNQVAPLNCRDPMFFRVSSILLGDFGTKFGKMSLLFAYQMFESISYPNLKRKIL